jgi:hypothetical protein
MSSTDHVKFDIDLFRNTRFDAITSMMEAPFINDPLFSAPSSSGSDLMLAQI